MNPLVVRGCYVKFYFDSSKIFVFADSPDVRVCEDTIDVSLCFISLLCASALNVTAPNTVNIDNIEL